MTLDVFFGHDLSYGSVSPATKHITIPANFFLEITFTVDAVPDAVYWQWGVWMDVEFTGTSGANMRNGLSFVDFPLFIVHDTPLSPQAIPWYGVLHDACGWADTKTSLSDVRNFITNNFYGSGAFKYSDTGQSYYSPSPGWTISNGYINAAYQFRLREFFEVRIAHPQSIFSVNCYDTSNYLSICFAATGSAPSFITMRRMNGNNQFTTNELIRIGEGENITAEWNNHQFTNISSSSGETYDSCLALVMAPDGTPSGIPVNGLDINFYWQNNINGNYFGVVLTPAPFQLSSIGQSFTHSVVLIN